jgi:hypothetical protein
MAIIEGRAKLTTGDSPGFVEVYVPVGDVPDRVVKSPTEGDVALYFVDATVAADLAALATAGIGTWKTTVIATKNVHQSSDANPTAFASEADRATLVAEADASFGVLL